MSVVTAWATAFIPSILLSAVVAQLLPEQPHPNFDGLTPGMLIFGLVVFAPVVETLIMGTVLLVLLRFMKPVTAIVLSAVGWGIAHSMQFPIWGLTIWWPFLVLSTLFVAWRERSLWLAFALPMVAHGMQNLGPALLIVSGKAG
ncbi:hypothetical protein GCM10023264_00490 [Sphingomonas daechungensis]|uniref:CPBP family intramembrane metalloprotease n=2 Tax=Sphingomonas daechungensis TaxID=1176646 RepID=A0ABX6T0X7_9SPHN|nr:CPBP family intramembrane metalloprotease [Sphingomonas daechungensis]